MGKAKLNRVDAIIIAASCILVAAVTVGAPFIMGSAINASITSRSSFIYDQYNTAFTMYEKAFADAKESNMKSGVTVANDKKDHGNNGVHVYCVKSGDTLTSISKLFGCPIEKIAAYNQIRDVNLIYANSSLRIPND